MILDPELENFEILKTRKLSHIAWHKRHFKFRQRYGECGWYGLNRPAFTQLTIPEDNWIDIRTNICLTPRYA